MQRAVDSPAKMRALARSAASLVAPGGGTRRTRPERRTRHIPPHVTPAEKTTSPITTGRPLVAKAGVPLPDEVEAAAQSTEKATTPSPTFSPLHSMETRASKILRPASSSAARRSPAHRRGRPRTACPGRGGRRSAGTSSRLAVRGREQRTTRRPEEGQEPAEVHVPTVGTIDGQSHPERADHVELDHRVAVACVIHVALAARVEHLRVSNSDDSARPAGRAETPPQPHVPARFPSPSTG